MTRIAILSGRDSSGSAGSTVDRETAISLSCDISTIETAYTRQTQHGVESITALSVAELRQAVMALPAGISAVKIGMLATVSITQFVTKMVRGLSIPVVLDPVLAASRGGALLEAAALPHLRDQLLPTVSLITPNLPEAEILLQRSIQSRRDVETAALRFIELGVSAVLIKGGHAGGSSSSDYLFDTATGEGQWYSHQRLDVQLRGTGCRLSTAIACYLARGCPLSEAVQLAKQFVYNLLHATLNRHHHT